MTTINSVHEYLLLAKENDYIVFSGKGIIDGLKNIRSKHDVYKVHKNTTKDKIVIREFRGRENLTLDTGSYDQEVVLLSKDEFKALPTLW